MKWFEVFDRTISLAARLFAVALGFAVGAVVAFELTDASVTIDEMSVPSDLANQGYTPSVVAHEILDEWANISTVATTTKRRQEISLGHGQVELSLPAVELSIGSIVDSFRSRLGFPQEHVRGGIVNTVSTDPKCANGCYTFLLDLDGPTPDHFSITEPKENINQLIREASRLAVEKLDPYLLANYYYASKPADEPNREQEVYRLVAVVLATKPSDDDTWAYTLLGAMLNKQERWPEAVSNFNNALAIDPHFAPALNSRCWAKAHIPGEVGDAIVDCRAALGFDPDSFETMDSLAFALEQNNQRGAAFDLIRCALRVEQRAPPAKRSGSVEQTYARLRLSAPNARSPEPTEAACKAITR